MKKLIILIALLIATPAHAIMFISGTSDAGAAPTYIARERFEGGSSTGGGDSDNEMAWTTNAGTSEDWNYTGTILEGSESGFMGTGDTTTIYTADFTAQSAKTFFTFMFRTTSTWSASRNIAIIADNVGNILCNIQQNTDDTVRLYNTGGSNAGTAGTFAADTTYYFKMTATPGSGANADCEFWSSTNGSSWINTVQISDGTWTADIAMLAYQTTVSSSSEYIIDDLRLDDVDINY